MTPMVGSSEIESKKIFNSNAFLAKKKATKQNTFIHKLVDTAMFAKFIEVQFLGGSEKQELIYFSKLISQGSYDDLLDNFVPKKIKRAYPANNTHIDTSSIKNDIIGFYQYTTFPMGSEPAHRP